MQQAISLHHENSHNDNDGDDIDEEAGDSYQAGKA
jgi:hypothetical protein